MGLNEMAEELIRSAKAEAERIEAEGEEKSGQILAEAREKAKSILEEAKHEASSVAENERREKISAAHLEAKRIVSHAKEKAISEAMEEILRATAEARDKDYKSLLKSLISEGMHEVGKDAVVKVSKPDHKLAHSLGFKVSEEPIDCIGGATVSSHDSRVVFKNTFEARFELRKERIRTAVHKSLFGKETGAKD